MVCSLKCFLLGAVLTCSSRWHGGSGEVDRLEKSFLSLFSRQIYDYMITLEDEVCEQGTRHRCINPSSGTMGVGPQMGCNANHLHGISVSAFLGYGHDCIQ